MATESPIRISEGTDKWSPRKKSTKYEPNMALEDFGLFLKGQTFQSLEIDAIPSRSESAPPNMEASIEAIEDIFSQRKYSSNPGSVHPRISANDLKFSSLRLNYNSLPSHEEESEEDRSSEKSAIMGYRSGSLESTQDVYPGQETVISDADTKAISSSLDGERGIIVNPHVQKKEPIIPQNDMLQQGTPQESNTSRVYSHMIYPGPFHYGSSPSNVSTAEVQPMLQNSGFAPPFYATTAPFLTPQSTSYPNLHPSGFFTPQYTYPLNSTFFPPYTSGYMPQGTVQMGFQNASFPEKIYGQVGVPMQPYGDPYHMQYFQPPVRDSYGTYGQFNQQTPRDNVRDSKKEAELVVGRVNMSNHYSIRSPRNVSPTMQFGSHSFHGGKSYGPQNQSWNHMNSYSFLEELRSGKGPRFELSDIAGHIDEFSVDQHGSRFIQQKLENCSAEEKASVFKEVVPLASKLMTDVFGNYVIQKLFEYGNALQKKDLANQLEGQILPLSLQMYGCRVIQKAFDVIDLEQMVRLSRELEGHVIRCVRDQNGNHVIQKCIESIPTDKIHFIISSFRGQVATLSMHPYGCRVIQRVLERCNDELQTKFIINEILDSVCSLAQDQYGNYVTQHVLGRGNPRERSEIIEKLSGSVVKLSQHKFASNVVEKCLEYGDLTARDVLIEEIIGHGDKNDNILIMMKDQYANYVIQKILQKCTINQREMLLGLIRNHLTALKKYTYGKHIVARFEQLYGEEIQP